MEIPKQTKIKCPWKDCKYEWTTISQMKMITCPSCLRKINRLKYELK